MGSVDIVVNAAAIHLQRRLERTTSRDWLSVLDTNLIGAVRIAAAFVPYMLDRRSGQIVNTISVGGLVPGDAASIAYDSAYGAVAAYTHSLDRQLRRDGVRASLYVVGATGPLPGLRSRAADHSGENLVKGLVEGRFLILADSRDLASLRRRWGEHELAGRLEIAIRKQ
jgi:NAD(P)-dependent dehydrogenase (short-subunit alcohol dehydrogenase family)